MTSVPLELSPLRAGERRGEPLVDTYGRVHRDLRISLTDRCSLRCTYCMPEQGVEWLAKESILSVEEIVRIARIAAESGITTFRLTGGEPLLRRDLVDIVGQLAELKTQSGDPVQVAMTTNGLGLTKVLDQLVAAGLSRLNISLDTLRPERFAELTRRDRHGEVIESIKAAQDSPLRPLKINAVAMRGVNEDEIVDLVQFAIDHDAQMRFIEQMPLDAGHTWDRSLMVTREEIMAALTTTFKLEPMPGRGGAPAEKWRINGTENFVGVIASVTAPFCGACDRVRLTADGQLRNCLFSTREFDLVSIIRGTSVHGPGTDDEIDELLRTAIAAKLPGHGINNPDFLQPARGMNAIGG